MKKRAKIQTFYCEEAVSQQGEALCVLGWWLLGGSVTYKVSFIVKTQAISSSLRMVSAIDLIN